MAGYVRWIAAKATETFGAESSKWAIEQRDQRASHDHARTSDNSISLMLGIEQFLSFAEHVGAIDAVQRAEMSEQAWGEVGRAAQQQDEEQHGENPSEQFRDLTRAALMAGRGHLAVKATGDAPSGLEETCGWRRRDHHDQNGELHSYWDARGDRLGWIDGDDLYLIPAAAYACAERLSGEQKRSLGLTQRTLGRRLKEAKWIVSATHGAAKKVRVHEQPGGKGISVGFFHLDAQQFLGITLPKVSQPTQMDLDRGHDPSHDPPAPRPEIPF
jgi:hypothetical protein